MIVGDITGIGERLVLVINAKITLGAGFAFGLKIHAALLAMMKVHYSWALTLMRSDRSSILMSVILPPHTQPVSSA